MNDLITTELLSVANILETIALEKTRNIRREPSPPPSNTPLSGEKIYELNNLSTIFSYLSNHHSNLLYSLYFRLTETSGQPAYPRTSAPDFHLLGTETPPGRIQTPLTGLTRGLCTTDQREPSLLKPTLPEGWRKHTPTAKPRSQNQSQIPSAGEPAGKEKTCSAIPVPTIGIKDYRAGRATVPGNLNHEIIISQTSKT